MSDGKPLRVSDVGCGVLVLAFAVLFAVFKITDRISHNHREICALRLAHAVTARDSAAVRRGEQKDDHCPTEAP